MKAVVVSVVPPTEDNYKGPTALLYQLLKFAPEDISIDLYYYNLSEVPQELVESSLANLLVKEVVPLKLHQGFLKHLSESNVSKYKRAIQKLKIPVTNMSKRAMPEVISFFKPERAILDRINKSLPDLVWLYSYWLVEWISKINCKNILVSGMDSAVLHQERSIRFGKWSSSEELKAMLTQMENNLNLEKAIGETSARVHMVGEADSEKFNANVGKQQSFFIPCPHYDYKPIARTITASMEKIGIVITGGNYETYVGNHLQEMIAALCICDNKIIRDGFQVSFIGAGYDIYEQMLQKHGFSTTNTKWVKDYAAELAQFQIQIFPIAVGTGTKGKVVIAIATGLLGIGSAFAFENINIIPNEDYCLYNKPEEIVRILDAIYRNKDYYTLMAHRASLKVQKYHDPVRTSQLFWEKALPHSTTQ